ncbi:MAG: GAF domain-containing protein [Candidatus Lokiarchaeota archaeon]|nr:GAF domain-containing protein [Candidatus Lokiarchaeota archaeon]
MQKSPLFYLNKVPLLIITIDNKLDITWINQFFSDTYNFNSNHAIGKSIDSFLEIKNNNTSVLFNSIHNSSHIYKVDIREKETLGWFRIHRIPMKLDEFHELVLFMDISEYINDIRERVNSELNYHTIFQNAPYSNVLLTLDGIVIDCNQKTCDIFELSADDIIGKSYASLIEISSEQYDNYEKIAENIRNGAEATPFPTEITTNKGTHKFLEIFPSLIRRNNQPYSMHLMIQDLTEEKLTQQKYSESVTVFAAFMENFSGIAFIKSPEGKYIYLNKTLLKLIDRSYEDCIDKTDFDLFPLDDAKQFRKNDLQVLNTLSATQLIEITSVKEENRHWLVNKFPIVKESEYPWAVAGMGVDISDQKANEHILKIQRDFGIALNEVVEIDDLFNLCIDSAFEIPEIDMIGIYLINKKSQNFELKYHKGLKYYISKKDPINQLQIKDTILLDKRQPLYRDYCDIEKNNSKIIQEEQIRSYAIIPILIGNEVIGVFNVASLSSESISKVVRSYLELISSQLGTTLSKIEAYEKIKLNERRLEALLKLNQMSYESEDEIYNFALQEGVKLTKSTHGFIAHVSQEEEITNLRIWSIHSQNTPPIHEVSEKSSEFINIHVWEDIVATKKPIIVNNANDVVLEQRLFPSSDRKIFRYLATPIVVQNKIIIVAGLWNKEEIYDDSDAYQLTLLLEAVVTLIQKKQDEVQREKYRRELEKIVDEISLNEYRLETLLKLNQMTEETQDDIYDFALMEGVKLTRSANGLISFLNSEGKMKFMRVWSPDFGGPPKIFEISKESQDLDKGVWVEAIHKKVPVVVNDAKTSEIAQRLLHTNHSIHRYMLIPVIIRDQMFAVAALSNKEEEYTESDVKQILLLIDGVTTLIQKKQDEQQREIYRRELEKSEKINALGILAGGIAHDFNNILTAILGNISLAEISDDINETKARLIEAKKAILRSKELTQQLLTFAKGGTPIKVLASISTLLRETTDFALRGSNVKAVYDISQELWSAEIDVGQISQVIHNLILNAIQAMPNGGTLQIHASNKVILDDSKLPLFRGNYIVFKIHDEGIGIPEKYLSQIFDPYFTTKEKGSGLGLATSYAIITKHGGHITVKSVVGVGSTFSVFIPAISKILLKEVGTMADNLVYGTGNILLMDDEEIIRKVAKRMMEKLGYTVTTTIDGNETVDAYRTALKSGNLYDLVVLDLTIPGGMGGRETIKQLKKLNPNVKAVVSSGYSVDPVMSEFRKYGFQGIIAKPYKIEDFSKVLDSVMNSINRIE